MMYLGIKTDQPEASLYLVEDGAVVAEHAWEAHRMLAKSLLAEMEKFLQVNRLKFEDIAGLVLFHGPGSFTGLRIGGSVANALAYGFGIPIVALGGDSWLLDGADRMAGGENDTIAALEYGGQIHITAPKK